MILSPVLMLSDFFIIQRCNYSISSACSGGKKQQKKIALKIANVTIILTVLGTRRTSALPPRKPVFTSFPPHLHLSPLTLFYLSWPLE